VLCGDEPLEPIAEAVLGPAVLGEELLQGAWRDVGVPGDQLDALTGHVGKLPSDVDAQVRTGVLAAVAVMEQFEERGQLRLELADLLDVHALPSGSRWQGAVSFRSADHAKAS